MVITLCLPRHSAGCVITCKSLNKGNFFWIHVPHYFFGVYLAKSEERKQILKSLFPFLWYESADTTAPSTYLPSSGWCAETTASPTNTINGEGSAETTAPCVSNWAKGDECADTTAPSTCCRTDQRVCADTTASLQDPRGCLATESFGSTPAAVYASACNSTAATNPGIFVIESIIAEEHIRLTKSV
jgi:hypothetical protein